MTALSFTAEAEGRIDVYVSSVSELTRSAVKRLADEGRVFLNGKPAKASSDVKCGDHVRVDVPDPVPTRAVPEDIPIDVIYEDDDIAVVNKPQGMTVHAGAGNYEGTLVNALLFRLKNLSGVGGAYRPGIVHRIDKDTSGLLVVAKNDFAHISLSEQIAKKTAKREYLALLEGVLKEEHGRVVTDIGRDPKNRLKMAVLPAGEGKEAVTEWSAVERFRENTLAAFRLQTGRTHQIRVHARYIGHPVVGDKVYGYQRQRFSLDGQLLHAYRLTLIHPRTGEEMVFTAPLPDYFEHVLEILRRENGS